MKTVFLLLITLPISLPLFLILKGIAFAWNFGQFNIIVMDCYDKKLISFKTGIKIKV